MRFTIPAAVVLGMLFLLPSAWCATLADGLIGYWPFDGTGTDTSTLGNDLTIYGGAGFADGLFGQALDLHGDASQYAAREADDQIYDFGSSDFTLQVWVNYYSRAHAQCLVEKFTGASGPGWTVNGPMEGTWIYHFYSLPSAMITSDPIDLPASSWHQVLVRRSSDSFQLLFHGQVIAATSSSVTVPDTTKPLLIGERDGGQEQPVDGRIDEVAIWNRALSDDEVSYLYNGGAGNPVLPPPESVTRRVPAEYPTIQAAIDASFDGDTVLVAPGEYVITAPITFRGKAITVRGEAGPETTVVRMADTPSDPEYANVLVFKNTESNATLLEGLRITGGRATTIPGPASQKNSGGGIYCSGAASPTFRNCTISGNTARQGGGVYCDLGSSPIFLSCTISNNSAGVDGSGFGGGVYVIGASPLFRECLIRENTSADWGGGVLCNESSTPAAINCTISGNTAPVGGGVYCIHFSSPTLTNCSLSWNSARDGGGALYCEDFCSPRLLNCTISGNVVRDYGSGVSCGSGSLPTLTNCIIWGNARKTFAGLPQVRYSCVEGIDLYPGEGNVNADPCFVGVSDLRLRPGSPCIDAGTNEEGTSTDIEGNARLCGTAVDMGAYEYCSPPKLVLTSASVADCTPAPAYVSVNLIHAQPTQAFSLGVAHDPAVATLTAIDFVDCPVVQALNGGQGPDYFGVDLAPGAANCAPEIAAGGTVYCIASQAQPSTETIPAGTDQPIARLTYEAVPGNLVGTESPLMIVGCLGGDLPREVVVTIDGLSYTPNVVGGTLTVDAAACRFIRGDANGDGRMDISDVVTLLMYLFENGSGPLRCEDAGDANDDGALDIGDAVRILGRLFADGTAFNPPYPGCGTDPTLDALRCWVSACQ